MPRTSTLENPFRLVKRLPLCRYCLSEASFESKTGGGVWASMCSTDFRKRGTATAEFRELVAWGSMSAEGAA